MICLTTFFKFLGLNDWAEMGLTCRAMKILTESYFSRKCRECGCIRIKLNEHGNIDI